MPKPTTDAPKSDIVLPEGVDETELVPDPERRPGHWYHEPTDTVFACGLDFQPKRPAKTDEAKTENTKTEETKTENAS